MVFSTRGVTLKPQPFLLLAFSSSTSEISLGEREPMQLEPCAASIPVGIGKSPRTESGKCAENDVSMRAV